MLDQIREIIERLLGRSLPEQTTPSTDTTDTTDTTRASSDTNPFDPMKDWLNWWQHERERKRQARQERKQQRKLRDRMSFGEELWGAAAGKRGAQPDGAKQQRLNLPMLQSESDLAALLGISLQRLRWFTHDRPAETVWHYVRYTIAKRSGGERLILAPKRALKELQRRVLHEILERVPTSPNAHGFVAGRSIVTNAQPHVGRAVVLNLDLKDFFPSISYERVRDWFIEAAGYSFPVASALALLCTERDREAFDHNDRRYYIGIAPRTLVQGAPTSPALANIIAWRMDRRLDGLARKYGFCYTRYADDLTFSGDDMHAAHRIRRQAGRIIQEERFELHPQKTRIYRRSSRQIVTGLVVNDQASMPRTVRRRMRAILHNARTTGLEAQNRNGHRRFSAYLKGMIGLIHMTSPQQAARLRAALDALDDQGEQRA
jgi:RNA-directed DNA polymerase